jgi:hypothetical protein
MITSQTSKDYDRQLSRMLDTRTNGSLVSPRRRELPLMNRAGEVGLASPAISFHCFRKDCLKRRKHACFNTDRGNYGVSFDHMDARALLTACRVGVRSSDF